METHDYLITKIPAEIWSGIVKITLDDAFRKGSKISYRSTIIKALESYINQRDQL